MVEAAKWSLVDDPAFERRLLPPEGRTDTWTPESPPWVGPTLVRLEPDRLRFHPIHRDLVVYPGALLPGLRTDRNFVARDEPVEVLVAAARLDGQLVSGALVDVALHRTGDPRPVDGCSVRPTENPARCALVPDGPGDWTVTAAATDDALRTSRSEVRVWVEGPGPTPAGEVQRRATGGTMPPSPLRVVPERSSVNPGETARVLIQAPTLRWSGTATLEGSGTLHAFETESGSTVLSVPVAPAGLGGRTLEVQIVGEDQDGAPFQARARVFLVVAPDLHLLTTHDETASAWTAGVEQPLALRATDRRGRPVADADLAVVVVQAEAVAEPSQDLGLLAPQEPPRWRLPESPNDDLRAHLLDTWTGTWGFPPPAYMERGGCAPGSPRLPPPPSPQSVLSYRQRLAAVGPQPLAAFAQVVTDADGRATVPVTLPYEGRWLVRVVAAGPDPSQVGRSEWTVETVRATPPP